MHIYPTVLLLHSYWRWVVLLCAAAAVLVPLLSLGGSRPFAPLGRKTSLLFVTSLDMQFLLGLALLFTSPVVKSAFADMAAAMKMKELRFFAVEHPTFMLLALVFAHVGSVLCKRAADDRVKYRRMLVWNALALVAILGGTPWWRPLFPGLL